MVVYVRRVADVYYVSAVPAQGYKQIEDFSMDVWSQGGSLFADITHTETVNEVKHRSVLACGVRARNVTFLQEEVSCLLSTT